MSFFETVDDKIKNETRALLLRGHRISRSSEEIADALYDWTKRHGGKLGDMSLQFIVHSEDIANGEWDERPFLVGIVVRESFGLNGDHELGLTNDELGKRVAEADARLDELGPSLEETLRELDVTMSKRALYFSWSGPLCSAQLVKGERREHAEDEEYYWSVAEGQPGYHFARVGSSQDEAPIGAFGFAIAEGIYDNFEEPVELTPALVGSADAKLKEHGITDVRLFVFPHYD